MTGTIATSCRIGRAEAVIAGLLSLGTTISQADVQPSPFLELQQEISLEGMGIGLDVAVDDAGVVYLSSESRGRIWRLDPKAVSWKPVDTGVSRPGGKGERMVRPTAIAASSQGRLWVADSTHRQLAVLGSSGAAAYIFEEPGLGKSASVSRSGEERMAVWDRENNALVQVSTTNGSVKRFRPPLAAFACVPADANGIYCVSEDRRRLVAYLDGKSVSEYALDGTYPKVGDLVVGLSGDVYVTDTLGRRLFELGPDLQPRHRFSLYETLFRSPTRIDLNAGNLWLVDEGRKGLLHFRLRTAESAFEHFLLGEEYLVLTQYESALDEFQKTRKLGLDSVEMRLHMGQSLYGLRRYPEALAELELALAMSPADATVLFWNGNVLFRMGRYPAAVRAYRACLEKSQANALARFNLAQANLSVNDFRAAEVQFSTLLAKQTDNDAYRLGLARAQIGIGNLVEAESLLLAIPSGSPMAGRAHYRLGKLYLSRGDARAALPLLESAAREGPYFRDSLQTLAGLHRASGNEERADWYAQKAAAITQPNQEASPEFQEMTQ